MTNSLQNLNDKIDFICTIGPGTHKLNNIYIKDFETLYSEREYFTSPTPDSIIHLFFRKRLHLKQAFMG